MRDGLDPPTIEEGKTTEAISGEQNLEEVKDKQQDDNDEKFQ